MSSCAKVVTQISGTAHGTKPAHVLLNAIGHLILNGQGNCTGACDSGGCTFGLTKLNGDIQVVNDADGQGVTITVTGDGQCFCG